MRAPKLWLTGFKDIEDRCIFAGEKKNYVGCGCPSALCMVSCPSVLHWPTAVVKRFPRSLFLRCVGIVSIFYRLVKLRLIS